MVYLNLRGKKLLAGITISSGLGFILFGYDNGVIGGLLTAPDFESTFNLDSTLQGVVTSLFELGCFFGSLVTAVAGGRLGRRTLAHLGTLSITVGALLQASSFSVGQLMVGRIVAGIGLGLISSNIAIWQSETAPANVRGTLVACSLSFLIVGQLLANLIDYGMNSYSGPVTWRFPIAFQAVLALLMSALLFFMPESPRYLIMKDRIEETVTVLQALKDTNDRETVAAEIAEIKEALLLELNSQKSWTDLFKSDKVKSRRRVIIACIVNLMQDLSGSTPIAYYTTFIFQNSVGFSRHLSLLMSIFLQLWFLLASTLTWWLIERVGRRRLFMLSACCMGMVMAVVAAMLAVNTRTSGIVAVVMIFAYQAFFTWGFMGGVWVYGPEILPLEYRSKGMGLATATLWLFSFVMVEIVPSSISNIGWKTYIIFAVFNFSFIPVIYLFFPETKGLSLELVDLAFMDDSMSPVKRAKELHKMIASGEELTLRTEVGGKDVDIVHIEEKTA
ncbi:general substrate transporter [Trichoderma sp. SZMC 28013]